MGEVLLWGTAAEKFDGWQPLTKDGRPVRATQFGQANLWVRRTPASMVTESNPGKGKGGKQDTGESQRGHEES